MEALEQLKSVLCDPEGNVCISGSDGDRKVISDALESLEQQVAALTEYNKTRTDELIAAGKQVSAQQAQMYEDRKQALVWRDQVAALTKERDVAVGQFRYVAKSNEKNFNDLAAAQAREAKLRELDPLDLAIMFHHTYERLAPNMEYDTRKETRIFDHESANGKLMVAVCAELLPKLTGPSPTDDSALMERLKQEYERGYADATREGVA